MFNTPQNQNNSSSFGQIGGDKKISLSAQTVGNNANKPNIQRPNHPNPSNSAMGNNQINAHTSSQNMHSNANIQQQSGSK